MKFSFFASMIILHLEKKIIWSVHYNIQFVISQPHTGNHPHFQMTGRCIRNIINSSAHHVSRITGGCIKTSIGKGTLYLLNAITLDCSTWHCCCCQRNAKLIISFFGIINYYADNVVFSFR
jgi:hypothetical protein